MIKMLVLQKEMDVRDGYYNELDVTEDLNEELEQHDEITPENIIDIKVNTVFVPMENVDVLDVRYIVTIFYKTEE